MKKYILTILSIIYGTVGIAQTHNYHISGYYMFNHPSIVDTYTAFQDSLDVDMGSYNTNFTLSFNHDEKVIKLIDHNVDQTFTYQIDSIDTLGVNTIAYFYKDGGFFCSFCVFQNTTEEKMIVYGSEMNGTFYGWQSVVK